MTPAEPRQHGWTLRFQTLRVSETLRVWEGKARAQGLVEFALILPFLLLLTLGVIEAGRMLAIFSSVSSAARQAARYGSVGGDTGSGSPYFLDCAGIRSAAQSNSVMWRLSNDDVKISYERPVTATGTFSLIGACGPSSATPTYSGGGATRTMTEDDIENGYRILITVTTTYRPVVPIVPIPPIPLTFAAARTIFPAIEGPTATPKPFPDVALTLSDSPDPVTISNPVTYTIVVANNGASGDAATGAIVVTQTVPSGWSGYTASGSGWTCSSSSAAPTLVTCRHSSSLAAGTTSTITVRMTAPNTSGTASTTATMRVAQADSTTSNNADTETTLVIAGSDLIISKKDVADPVLPSAPPTYSIITYTLVVTNTQGEAVPSGATTTVTDVIPLASGVSFLSASGFGWSCTFVSGEVKCTRTGSLAVGAAFPPIFIQVYAPDFENIVINDTGGVSLSGGGGLGDPVLTNNTFDPVTTTVRAVADIYIIKFASATQVGLNGLVNFTLRVTNNGPLDAANVVVDDAIPSLLRVQSVSGPGWDCSSSSGQTVNCSLPTLTKDATSDITVVTQAPASVTPQTVTNQATVTSDTEDSDTSNNTSNPVGVQLLDCNPGVPSATYSTISAAPGVVLADGETTTEIVVTIRDNCPNFIENASVSLSSSRGGSDTLTPSSGTTDVNGQAVFFARSGTVGDSTYTAVTSGVTLTSGSVAFKCVDYLGGAFFISNDVAFGFDNQTGVSRRLYSLTLTWTGGTDATEIDFPGTSQAWVDNSGSPSALTVSEGGTGKGDWKRGAGASTRTLANGAGDFLTFLFKTNLASGTTYTLSNVVWDNGSGGNRCTTTGITTFTR